MPERLGGRGTRSHTVTVWAWRVGLTVALLGLWQYQGSQSDYWKLIVSSPQQVLLRCFQWIQDPVWWGHVWATLEEAVLGYVLGVGAALVLVAVLAPSPWISRFMAPFLAALNALPKIALAPLFIFWFGTTLQSKVYFVASLISFIVLYGVLTGIRTIDPIMLANTRLYGASKWDLLWHVYVPAILTWLFSSLRLSWAWALLAAVVGEYLGAIKGLGFLIASAQQALQADVVIAGILVVAFAAVAFDRLLIHVERPMSKWRAF